MSNKIDDKPEPKPPQPPPKNPSEKRGDDAPREKATATVGSRAPRPQTPEKPGGK